MLILDGFYSPEDVSTLKTSASVYSGVINPNIFVETKNDLLGGLFLAIGLKKWMTIAGINDSFAWNGMFFDVPAVKNLVIEVR